MSFNWYVPKITHSGIATRYRNKEHLHRFFRGQRDDKKLDLAQVRKSCKQFKVASEA